MKKIMGLGLLLIITAGLFGCTSTGTNNANLRNTNTNTGYMTNNANMASPMPAATTAPAMNSNMGSNMKSGMNSNMKSNMNSNMNSKMPMNK